MTRKPKVAHAIEAYNEFARSPDWSSIMKSLFGDEILPSRREHSTFDPDHEIHGFKVRELYEQRREWVERIKGPDFDKDFSHEKYLDSLFWKSPATDGEKLICVLGSVGCGKSTFVDYYLRCHCPNFGSNGKEFSKKLIIHFDAKPSQSSSDFAHNFYSDLYANVCLQCEKRGLDIHGIVTASLSGIKHNIRLRAATALTELSRLARKKGPDALFEYIVLVVDNLDQCDSDVQKRAISQIADWINNPSVNLWKVIMPLWPETFERMQQWDISLIRGTSEFSIGKISGDELVSQRERLLTKKFGQITFLNWAEAQRGHEFFSGFLNVVKEHSNGVVMNLANLDIRRFFSIVGNTLQGEAAYSYWKTKSGENTRPREYELLNAILVGHWNAMVSVSNPIANVFSMGHEAKKPRDLLVGVHALLKLDSGIVDRRSFESAMTGLGYADYNIDRAYRQMRLYNWFHDFPGDRDSNIYGGDNVNMVIHENVIKEYIELLRRPAYIDNVAMVTPVDTQYLERINHTTLRPDELVSRVLSTEAFLEFLRENEEDFCRVDLLPADARDSFQKSLRKQALPWIWKICARSYVERLSSLLKGGFVEPSVRVALQGVLSRGVLLDCMNSQNETLEVR